MSEKNTIIIVEDHKLLREGLQSLLNNVDTYQVVGEAADGIEAIKIIKQKEPDLILLDLSMPRMNGISVVKEIKRMYPKMRILVLTIHDSDEHVLEAFEAGADGYCLKDAGRKELLIAIDSILCGKTYISPAMADIVLEGYVTDRMKLKTKTTWQTVTQREKEVLKLVGEGYQNKEVADLLHISVKTVEKHRANIMKKLDLHNTSALTAYAIDKGLVAR